MAYFDLFRYPLNREEILQYIDQSCSPAALEPAFKELQEARCIFSTGPFFSLSNDPGIAQRRKEGNDRAAFLLPTAYRIGRFLYGFPFVRGVGISGSLSKNFADTNADIDFFIITAANRLWIARTLMHLFKKFSFLVQKQHWFCMNYYIDEAALVINEKNIFTATEVVTVIPVCGEQVFADFFAANAWSRGFYPNHPSVPSAIYPYKKPSLVKKAVEYGFNNGWGERLDQYWMRVTSKRWAEKERKHQLNMKGDPLGLKTDRHFARPNPEYFQKKILARMDMQLKALENKWNIRF